MAVDLYCTQEFKDCIESLRKKKPYRDVEEDLKDYFFDKEIAEISSGSNINNNLTTPFIKKRLDGRGGYRVYYLLVIHNNIAYLSFVHPKTGPDGFESLKTKDRNRVMDETHAAIKNKDLYSLSWDDEKGQLKFKYIKE